MVLVYKLAFHGFKESLGFTVRSTGVMEYWSFEKRKAIINRYSSTPEY
jgi:hypothetical protein